jgi:cytoskeleton protein RodZ
VTDLPKDIDSLKAGEFLKQARTKQRLSLAECGKRTHIAPHYLEAIEDGHWTELPSVSHRRGFLELYSRILGVSLSDVLSRLEKELHPQVSSQKSSDTAAPVPKPFETKGFYPASSAQIMTAAILILVITWGAYHLFYHGNLESSSSGWTRPRVMMAEPRLQSGRTPVGQQKVRIQAVESTWIRVANRRQLLFEGRLKQGSQKEWSGLGPFEIRLADVSAVAIFWNDQPFDATRGARGHVNTLVIPPSR